jgi:hypothetical protein
MDVGTSDSLDDYLKIEISIKHVDDYNEHKVLKRSQGSHAAKDEFKNRAMKECALKAKAKVTIDMADVTLKKTYIMENQSMLTLFMILVKQMLDFEAREYLKLWH